MKQTNCNIIRKNKIANLLQSCTQKIKYYTYNLIHSIMLFYGTFVEIFYFWYTYCIIVAYKFDKKKIRNQD